MRTLAAKAPWLPPKWPIEDVKAAEKGLKVEVVSADHQNKSDIAVNKAREWYDQDGVDAIFDVPNSGVALAISALTQEKNKIFIDSGAASSDLTGANARRTPSTGLTTPGSLRTAPGPRW